MSDDYATPEDWPSPPPQIVSGPLVCLPVEEVAAMREVVRAAEDYHAQSVPHGTESALKAEDALIAALAALRKE